jgi:peptidoglycan/LPS O-acetylase OafA/YrhL
MLPKSLKYFIISQKLNSNIKIIALNIFYVISLSGCLGKRESALWTVGSTIFLMFIAIVLLNLLMPYLHHKSFFQKLSDKAKKPVKIFGFFILIFGLAIMAFGILHLSGDFGPKKLTFFLGIIVFIFGGNLIYWSKSDVPEKKALHAKLASICLGFIIALSYIINGAPGILEK